MANIKSCMLVGLEGKLCEIETDISGGIPAFEIVGLPDAAVKESKERIRAAFKNSSLEFPRKRIIVNLAPANLKKEGTSFDIPIILSILAGSGLMEFAHAEKTAFFGEISLDGAIRPVPGILPMALTAKEYGIDEVFVPADNAKEAAFSGLRVYGVECLTDILEHFRGNKRLCAQEADFESYFREEADDLLDFCDVKGQEVAKRGAEIAAAGSHNILFIGSPGSGKTMIAKRIPSILPDLTFDEAMETSKIHSISGLLTKDHPIITVRPFRSPHHTISTSGLSGGGMIPKPGELSLAHNGVLFLDELCEFHKDVLEIMRQPLEDRKITVARVNATLTYPCNIMLVASMNPCKCGYFGDPKRACTCSPGEIKKYISKISGPLLDRIDLHTEVSSLSYDELAGKAKAESSSEIKKRVNRARAIQKKRYEGLPIHSNAELYPALMREFCALGKEENKVLKSAFEAMGLSARAYDRILKVSRTIADLDGSESIRSEHIMEAIQYRTLDRKYWGNNLTTR